MLDKTVRIKRDELRNKSAKLREIALDEKSNKVKSEELRHKQDEIYKKWQFYNNLIKGMERVKNNEMQDQKDKQ